MISITAARGPHVLAFERNAGVRLEIAGRRLALSLLGTGQSFEGLGASGAWSCGLGLRDSGFGPRGPQFQRRAEPHLCDLWCCVSVWSNCWQ